MTPQEVKIEKLSKIYTTLLSFLSKKNISDISISELCRTAGVSRTYYYRHYRTMQEIIMRYQEHMIKTYFRMLPHKTSMNFTKLMTAYFKLMKSHGDETKLLVRAGQTNTLIKTFKNVFYFLIRADIIHWADEYFISYMAGAVITVQIQWVDNNMDKTPEQMGKMLNMFFFEH